MLTEQPLALSGTPFSESAQRFVEDGRARFQQVNCFAFVPSNYHLFWRTLDALPRGRVCEWGSGFGIATGLAEMLGFDAFGIETDAGLVDASRRLLADFGLSAPIAHGDYLDCRHEADVYFVYCWPSKFMPTESHFHLVAPAGAKLLICHGQSDIRCKVRGQEGHEPAHPLFQKS